MQIIELGTRVRAIHTITDDGEAANPDAVPFESGYIHALPGEEGTVVFIEQARSLAGPTEEAAITVEFDRTGTATMVLAEEIEVVKPS